MVTRIRTSISIQKTLFHQAEIAAQHLNISQDDLFETAIEHFIRKFQSQPTAIEPSNLLVEAAKTDGKLDRRVINQGDLYWLHHQETDIPHPHVVVQENVFNHSRLNTVIVCSLTSNIKRINIPGNILLDVGEANLPRQSVVEVAKVATVDKAQLAEYIGSLTEGRINQILAGMRFLQKSFFER